MINDVNFNSFDFYLKGIVDEKEQLIEIKAKRDELKKLIQNMPWQDLKIKKDPPSGSNSINYRVSYTNHINDKIKEIECLYNTFNHLEDVGQEILYGGEHLSFNCSIQIANDDKRIDITDIGIPRTIRGLGLGCKIYRAILNQEEYLSSKDHQLSGYGKMLWNSIRNNLLFFTFYHKSRAFCFASDKEPKKIIEILEEQINPNYFTSMLWDNDFVTLHRQLIEQSSLSKLL